MATSHDLDRAVDSSWEWVSEQTRAYLATGGAEGHVSDGVTMLVLATTGRRTGLPRRTCLIYGVCGDEYVVVASKGGSNSNPQWFENLLADPTVGVQVGARRLTARARVASAEERRRLWPQMVAGFPLYESYAQATERVIPLVLLRPVDEQRTVVMS